MKPRLRRALQRGGVTPRVRTDTWGVWRSQDRRGRMIGTVSGADIDLLRLRQCLKPLGDKLPLPLVWTGPIDEMATSDTANVAGALTNPARSLLDLLLRDRVSPMQRDRIRQACQAYLADLEQIASGGSHVTMNWDRLSLVDKTHRGDHVPRAATSQKLSQARGRLSALAQTLSEADLRFLEGLVLREETRTVLARRFALRAALADQRGLSVLRALLSAYEGQLR